MYNILSCVKNFNGVNFFNRDLFFNVLSYLSATVTIFGCKHENAIYSFVRVFIHSLVHHFFMVGNSWWPFPFTLPPRVSVIYLFFTCTYSAALQIQDRSPKSRPVTSLNQSQTQLMRPVATGLALQRNPHVCCPSTPSAWFIALYSLAVRSVQLHLHLRVPSIQSTVKVLVDTEVMTVGM